MLLCCELNFFITSKIKGAGKGRYLSTERFTRAGQSTYRSSNDSVLYKIIAVLLHVPWPHYVEHLSTQTNAIIINLWLGGSRELRQSQHRGSSDARFSLLAQVFGHRYFNSLSQSPLVPFFLLSCVACIQTGANFLILWDASYPSRINNSNRKIMIEARMIICKIFFQNMQNF